MAQHFGGASISAAKPLPQVTAAHRAAARTAGIRLVSTVDGGRC